MATVLQPEQTLRRLVKVYGIEGLVEVSLNTDGISFRIPKTRKYATLTWAKAVASSATPSDVPCWLSGDATKFLVETVKKQVKSNQKRIDRAFRL